MKTTITNWLDIILLLGWACLLLSLLTHLFYSFQLAGIKKRTDKYRFASANESRSLRRASAILAMGIVFFSFHAIIQWIGRPFTYHYFFVGFFALIIGFAVGYALWAIIKYYYPFILEKRLTKIRFKPMKSKETGNPMKLLTEDEEDVHLTEAMISEESAFSADYDVWIDEQTGHKVIEKYDTHYHALICDECNFRTLKDIKEEILKEPTNDREGLLRKEYRCSYCGHYEVKEFKIASWIEESEMQQLEEAPE